MPRRLGLLALFVATPVLARGQAGPSRPHDAAPAVSAPVWRALTLGRLPDGRLTLGRPPAPRAAAFAPGATDHAPRPAAPETQHLCPMPVVKPDTAAVVPMPRVTVAPDMRTEGVIPMPTTPGACVAASVVTPILLRHE